MTPRLVERQPQAIACLRYVGPYGPPLGEFWRQRFIPWLARQQLRGAAQFGIGHDDPGCTPPEACRYDCAVAVPAGFEPEPGISLTTLPGGLFAVFGFRGVAQEIGAAWAQAFGTPPPAGWQLDPARPDFEHYPPGAAFDEASGVFECEICLPLKPLLP